MKLNHNSTPLFDAVKKYIEQDTTSFHVPGHKSGKGLKEFTDFTGENVLRMDLTEVDGLDNLGNPSGPILESQELLADAFGAKNAHMLINGTTLGIHTMIMSTCTEGDKIIIPRNSHKSVYNAIILCGAIPVYLYPEIDENLGIPLALDPKDYDNAINSNTDAKAVFAINPTYHGIGANLPEITAIAHSHGMYVLVDEAHGSHMYFHSGFPVTAMNSGADMSTVSLHKTGGSMTQTSALLIGNTKVNDAYIKQVINLLQTSSPSYVLMSSIDVARKQLALDGLNMIDKALDIAKAARNSINQIEGLYAPADEVSGFYFDQTKLLINVSQLGLTGYEMDRILRREYGIQVELSDMYNILAVISLGDTFENSAKLVNALKNIASNAKPSCVSKISTAWFKPVMEVSPRTAFYAPKKCIGLRQAVGKVAGGSIIPYPPGVPLVCAGERITSDIVDYADMLKQQGGYFEGILEDDKVLVLESR